MDLVVRRARVLDGAGTRVVDIGVAAGRIAAVEPLLAAEAPAIDAENCLVIPGLVETHLHLDKTCIMDRCGVRDGTVAEAVRETEAAKRGFTPEDVYARGRQTLDRCIAHGTTQIRTHVELDPGIGMTGFDGVEVLARDYGWAVDLELCVFPQEGLLNRPGTEALLREGLRRGARAIGAVPYTDTDPRGQIDRVFAIARVRRRDRHAPRPRGHDRGDAGRVRLPQDGGARLGRPGGDRARDADEPAAAGGSRRPHGPARGRGRRGDGAALDGPVPDGPRPQPRRAAWSRRRGCARRA
jgi:hypothetical protein